MSSGRVQDQGSWLAHAQTLEHTSLSKHLLQRKETSWLAQTWKIVYTTRISWGNHWFNFWRNFFIFFSKNEKLDDIQNQSLLENAIDVHFYWKYKKLRKQFYQILLYVHNRNEFIRKLKIKYPWITDEEIWKLFKLYLRYHPNENGDYIFWGKAALDL